MKNSLSLLSLSIVASGFVAGIAQAAPQNGPANQPAHVVRKVEIVLALDTSSSMDGLIDAAREKLWDVVTLLGKAQPRPELRVALISYGNTGYPASNGWVRVDSDLTTDLDTLYGRLFALRTNGGDEYVARAVQTATHALSWSQDRDALRIIFVAGNESAEQDPKVRLEDAIGEARARNIYVNAIFCGPERAGTSLAWGKVASLGNGQYAAVDQNHAVAIAAPQDAELQRLSDELNQTYVAYGHEGRVRSQNQAAQDKNAAATSAPAAAARAAGKASAMYRADDWDLVDATANKKKDVKAMQTEELPAEMREMKPEARAAYVAEKSHKRDALRHRITEVNAAREKYVTEQRRTTKRSGTGVDEALLGGLRDEAVKSGFAF